MQKSMTGFGKAKVSENGVGFTVEIRSLNSKQLDLGLRIPTAYREVENDIRALVAQRVVRGKVDVTVSVESNSAHNAAHINYELFNETLRGIELQQVVFLASDAAAIERFYKDFDVEVDRALAVAMLKAYEELATADAVSLRALLAKHGGAENYANWLYDNTTLGTLEGFKASNIAEDPMTEFANAVIEIQMYVKQYAFRNLSNIPDIQRWYQPYVKALMEWDKERAFFPDANLTLRVAYGKVAGYEYEDAVWHNPQTTLEGIIAKDNPEIYDYNVPQALRDAYAKKDYGRWGIDLNGKYTVPVCFIATNHTTGGNSGSPVINANGELIGVNFDRTWLSTMSDIEFDETLCRNIICDIRYVLFVVDKVGGAGWLINEMGL